LAALACGCNSSPPWTRLAQLQLTAQGEGQVTVLYSIGQDGQGVCDGGECLGGIGDQGSVGMAYIPGSDVSLTAQPDKGWAFVSYKVWIYGQGGPSDHSVVTETSSDPMYLVHNTGQELQVLATFQQEGDAGADDAASEPDAGSD
jgi:hypothetical protein